MFCPPAVQTTNHLPRTWAGKNERVKSCGGGTDVLVVQDWKHQNKGGGSSRWKTERERERRKEGVVEHTQRKHAQGVEEKKNKELLLLATL